jgi:lipoprotein-anchoring transpeptidase ErfK/SrfK
MPQHKTSNPKTNMKPTATFLGPVNHLPPEGSDFHVTGETQVEQCASLFSDSEIYFDIALDGVTVLSNPQQSELFQVFSLHLNENESEIVPIWDERAYAIQLQSLFPDATAFDTLSDASEPEDFVRRFLEVLGSSLSHSEIGEGSATVPMIRWAAGADENSARVQLLGFLLANENQFETFCESNQGEFGFIFEDTEVQAHGLREAITVLALLGVTLGSVTQAQAGLFENFGKKKEMRIQQVAYQNSIQQAPAPVPSAQKKGWQDVHRDAYINYDLLAARKNGEKRIVVDVASQRAYLIIDNVIALDTAVSTARNGKYTPRGEFKITERVKSGKTSSIYGCSLPYWQRLDESAIGFHIGDLPGYPASAGCIRLPESIAPILFENTASGITVQVVDSWNPASLQQSLAQQDVIVAQVVPQQGS